MTRGPAWPVWVAAALALATPVGAQVPAADSAAVEYFAPPGPLARAGISFYGDARLRRDVVRDRPGATSDLTLTRFTVRAGVIRAPLGSPLRAELGVRWTASDPMGPSCVACISIGGNGESRIGAWEPVLNEELTPLVVDRALVRITPGAGALAVSLGRQRSPLRLTEMIWDDDLRPLGAAAIARRDFSADLGGRLGAGWLSISGLDAQPGQWLGAVQLSALVREEAPAGAEATVSWLRFGGSPRFARQNEITPSGDALARFEVLDLQLGARAEPARVPLALRLDLARNLAHGRDRDGVRVRLAIGGAGLPAGAEVGWVFQRVERELLPGGFNSDDWWFHSRMRGHQAWLRAGLGGWLEAKIAGFDERRDDVARRTRRLTLELSARWPAR